MARLTLSIVALIIAVVLAGAASAQQGDGDANDPVSPLLAESGEVAVEPSARDEEIESRLRDIYAAVPGVGRDVVVEVREGVVALRGVVDDEAQRALLAEIARKTQDVVAVIDRTRVAEPSLLDFSASLGEARSLWREFVRLLPRIVLSLLGLVATILATFWVARFARARLARRTPSLMLAQLLGNACAVPVLLLGLYVVLRLADLTNLALTVLGGTGLFGLVIGIAFRDIAENYLASILISTRRPFRTGDTIVVGNVTGVVQTVTTRGTLLVTFDGNHVLIPNSTIYKSVVTNLTANPKIRESFLVGIGANESVTKAQRIALETLRAHDAILADPDPMILVDDLGASTVNLRVYFWIDSRLHATIKVKSAAIRLVRRALLNAGISMPPDTREVYFPEGVPVRMIADKTRGAAPKPTESEPHRASESESADEATEGEGGLGSELDEIQEQARASNLPDQGADLLRGDR